MILVKLTILVLFILFVWTLYVSSKMRTDMSFNAKITVEKKYPKWYLGYVWFVFGALVMTFISLVYLLFVFWK